MRFYTDIVAAEDTSESQYHRWSDQSVQSFWKLWTSNPFLKRQFYPLTYWQDLLAWAKQRLPGTPSVVVDVGCGNGNLVVCLLETFGKPTIVGVDLTEESLSAARQRFEQEPNVRFQVGSLTALPFSNGTVDLVTCTEVLEHTFPDVFAHSFAEVSRVLKVGGYYLGSVPFNEPAYFVCCPGCHEVFTPYQHMNFEITYDDIRNHLTATGFELVAFFTPADLSSSRSAATGTLKRVLRADPAPAVPGLGRASVPRDGRHRIFRAKGVRTSGRPRPVDHMLSRPFACGRAARDTGRVATLVAVCNPPVVLPMSFPHTRAKILGAPFFVFKLEFPNV